MGNIATVWLSEDLDEDTGRFFDIWSALNPLGPVMEVGEGAPVRAVMVNPESLSDKAGFMPAYTITEFYDVQSGDVADERFVLPERSEEHTSELQSLMRISYAVFCLKKKHGTHPHTIHD